MLRSRSRGCRWAAVAVVGGLVAGCSRSPQQTQNLPPPAAEETTYTFVQELPPVPAGVSGMNRNLQLVKRADGYYLVDANGRAYPAGRDAKGNVYPTAHVSGARQRLYYDSDRDRYYYVARDAQGRYYRRYTDDPQDRYYADNRNYAAYKPVAKDQPVVKKKKGFNPAWLLAIPAAVAAYYVLRPDDDDDKKRQARRAARRRWQTAIPGRAAPSVNGTPGVAVTPAPFPIPGTATGAGGQRRADAPAIQRVLRRPEVTRTVQIREQPGRTVRTVRTITAPKTVKRVTVVQPSKKVTVVKPTRTVTVVKPTRRVTVVKPTKKVTVLRPSAAPARPAIRPAGASAAEKKPKPPSPYLGMSGRGRSASAPGHTGQHDRGKSGKTEKKDHGKGHD